MVWCWKGLLTMETTSNKPKKSSIICLFSVVQQTFSSVTKQFPLQTSSWPLLRYHWDLKNVNHDYFSFDYFCLIFFLQLLLYCKRIKENKHHYILYIMTAWHGRTTHSSSVKVWIIKWWFWNRPHGKYTREKVFLLIHLCACLLFWVPVVWYRRIHVRHEWLTVEMLQRSLEVWTCDGCWDWVVCSIFN